MTRNKKILSSALVVGVLGSVSALGVFGLFSATTQNSGNEVTAGTVAISDNDGGQSMFNVVNAKPGDTWTRCIKVTYTGSLQASVHMYLKDAVGTLAPYLNLAIVQGTQASPTFPGCNGFTPDATGTDFQGPVVSPVPGSYDAGLPVLPPGGATAWQTGSTLVFQFTMTLDPSTPDSLQGSNTGAMAVVWESRNQ